MRIFFDNRGNLKSFDREIIAATSSGHELFIYAEFDTVVNTDLMVTVTFKRSDGFIIGPLEAKEHIDDSGVLCRVVLLNKSVLAVPGPLELTVRYDYYGFNDLGERVRVITRALAKVVAHVYDAVGGLPEDDLALYFLMDRVNEHESRLNAIGDIQSNIRLQVDGEDKTKGSVMIVDINDVTSNQTNIISNTFISETNNDYKNKIDPYEEQKKLEVEYLNIIMPYEK